MSEQTQPTREPEVTPKDILNFLKKRWEPWNFAWGALAALVPVLIFLVWTGPALIANKARETVLEERFLGELAGRVRPQCVFNMKGATVAETASLSDYVAVPITVRQDGSLFIVTVRSKKLLRFQPLVTCINYPMHTVKATPTSGYDWEITLGIQIQFSEGENPENFLFKLEILH